MEVSAKLLVGDCRAMMRQMEPESVQVCCTSIPYWGLRAYGTPPQVWGGQPDCQHVWGSEQPGKRSRWGDLSTLSEKQASNGGSQQMVAALEAPGGQFCQHCQAWRGELGLEPTLGLFIAHIVEVFCEVRRVLRKDGTLWLNIGDTFAGGVNGRSAADTKATGTDDRTFRDKPFSTACDGLKPKDLCMVPHRVAIALQDDGWWIRMDNVWAKRNPMPESITDRPTKAHEYVFLCSRSERYFYDAEAVREKGATTRTELLTFGERPDVGYPGHINDRRRAKMPDGWDTGPGGHGSFHRNGREKGAPSEIRLGRNLRSVWDLATQPFPEAHFATFPEELPRRAILAGTSEHGACAACGAPYRRVTEKGEPDCEWQQACGGDSSGQYNGHARKDYEGTGAKNASEVKARILAGMCERRTLGWEPTCTCNDPREPVPCVVFDPFAGSGTTLAVALRHGRSAVGVELNPEYAEIARRRIGKEQSLFTGALEL